MHVQTEFVHAQKRSSKCAYFSHTTALGRFCVHLYLGRQILRPFAVETICDKVQHIPSVYLVIWSTVEPAGYEIMDGQYTMKFQETLFHFLNPVYIYFFNPLFVHYCVPVIQTNMICVMLFMTGGSCVRSTCSAMSVQCCFVSFWWQMSSNCRTERLLYAAQVCCE